MERRCFIKLCGGAALLMGARPSFLLAAESANKDYQRARIVDGAGKVLGAEQLAQENSYIFHYPYVSTPALLMDLGHRVDGGVGASGGIVAFTAICTHQFAYPKGRLSAVNYEAGESQTAGRAQVVTCCLHGSAFDPAQGGAVIGGPATHALTAIALEYDEASGALFAVGTRGEEIYPQFFRSFKRELRKQYGRGAVKQMAQGDATARLAEEYSKQQVRC